MLLHRLLTGAVGIPVALGLIYLGGWYLAAAVTLLALAGLNEFYQLMDHIGLRPIPVIGYAAALLIVPPAASSRPAIDVSFALLGAVLLIASFLQRRLPVTRPSIMDRLVGLLAGVIYVPLLLSFLLSLRSLDGPPITLLRTEVALDFGARWLALVMIASWATDTAAYAVGKAIGRHKLWPAVSPGKTIEGSLAGLLATIVVATGLAWPLHLPVRHGLILGAVLGVAGQLGDLTESAIKRRAGVKNSGAILPGHGGILDRFDSLLFDAPLAFYYLRLVAGA